MAAGVPAGVGDAVAMVGEAAAGGVAAVVGVAAGGAAEGPHAANVVAIASVAMEAKSTLRTMVVVLPPCESTPAGTRGYVRVLPTS